MTLYEFINIIPSNTFLNIWNTEDDLPFPSICCYKESVDISLGNCTILKVEPNGNGSELDIYVV